MTKICLLAALFMMSVNVPSFAPPKKNPKTFKFFEKGRIERELEKIYEQRRNEPRGACYENLVEFVKCKNDVPKFQCQERSMTFRANERCQWHLEKIIDKLRRK